MPTPLRVLIAALEAAANGIVITDQEGAILWVNPAYTLLTGYSAEEAIGKTPRILKSGKHDQAFYQRLWETILAGKVWHGETINRRKDGSLYTDDQTITPVRDERGQISHFIAIKQDITDRKWAEEALRELALQLEARVEDRTRELQKANRHLEEVSRHKSAFLANMSHELRTPLNSVLGFAELLRDQPYGPLSAKQARFVDNIHQSGQYLLALINDLLDLSKVEAGKLDLRPEAFVLHEALTAALTKIRPQSEAKRLQFELQVDPALTTLTADPVRFTQIVLNLLSNAVKFTPDGGRITVSARTVRGPECVPPPIPPPRRGGGAGRGCEVQGAAASTSDTSEFVEIAMQDTGIGIKAEDLPKLFQPFTQLEPAPSTGLRTGVVKERQGTGLGLALAKHLVELHGGQIVAASEGVGRGSTFTVRFPTTPPPPERVAGVGRRTARGCNGT